jgi:hypothetical protein
MPTFAEIEPLSLSDGVFNALKDAFFAGELKPGDPIVERDVARQMKVGTPVVREAGFASRWLSAFSAHAEPVLKGILNG